ncbi:hypothetical protein F66182_5434 [Fusarium sp. NRRL 66182]|nr:hypothetical protein F66182_5434 [Fusarium sp. NRRL 66182]
MHVDAIRAWINTTDPSSPSKSSSPSPDSMSSPSKRRREDDPFVDLDKTPRRPNAEDILDKPAPSLIIPASTTGSTAPASVFTGILASRPHLPSQPSQLPGSPSPSKQYRDRNDLLRLDRPVRFIPEADMKKALPADIHDRYDQLAIIEFYEAILPAALKDLPGVKIPDVRPHMWQPPDESQERKTILDRHHRLCELVERSEESSKRRRSEAAWNSLVHSEVLYQLSRTSSVTFEDITSARIVPRFRPCNTTPIEFPSDEANESSIGSYSTNTTTRSSTAKSVHKMVDFALALEPDQDLAAIIQQFMKTSPDATLNQTAYYPLKTRPAPVFIETKTSAANSETASVQLGVWIAAWHESMRSLLKLGKFDEPVITVPCIQVTEGTWTLMFAVDAGEELHILERNFRIGNSGTPIGIYQLQAALSAISQWIEGTFKTWITRVLLKALA